MNIINDYFGWLKGRKTYLIGALMIALGLLNGNNQLVLEGLGFITLRLGISGIAKK